MANAGGPVVCPRDPVWVRRMLDVLPPGLRGKLEKFEACPGVNDGVNEQESGEDQGEVIRPAVLRS